MSLMTSGVKIGLRPRMFLRDGESSTAIGRSLQDELALVRLEVVVVPQLLAADELAEGIGFVQPVDAELAVDQLLVRGAELGLDAVDAERGDLAGHVDGTGVHRVAEAGTDIAAVDLAAALHHEADVHAAAAADDDRAALLVDAGAGPDRAPDHEVPAAQGRAGEGAGVLLDHHHAGHHVLAD